MSQSMTRRQMLGLSHPPLPGPEVKRKLLFQPQAGPAGDVLVCVFLRGGADGLHLVAPYGDSAYYAQRPRIGVPRPDDRRAPMSQRGVALDGFFALNPALAPLHAAYQAGHLAVVHAAGSPDQTRSHFSAMETMERGVGNGASSGTGWLGRHLQSLPGHGASPLRALAIGEYLPQSLEGSLGASAIPSLDAFRLSLPASWSSSFQAGLASLYDAATGPIADAGRETRRLLNALEQLSPDRYHPEGGARYPATEFGRGMAQIAQLVKAELGLEVACLDLGGWDSHIGQEPLLAGLMPDLAGSFAAFHADLGRHLDRVTVVAMSEFGRRVRENGGLGTDHGRATCLWLMGGGINGGRVIADWPGLAEERLEGPGDLRVTIDYRDVLAEVVARRLRNPAWANVFPGYRPTFRHLCSD
jgi:uncharacterized protein (DUF1501 family)